ncbi:triose-phosphate isomerase [Mycoplasma phocoeninasale]|uniref:Triosephosphate isomerase n=1 Tax=Mycoplasma phocoeninasale TaxID=2726117 RepID=A0A858U0K6_9MOLU|nr:triose-phosphate isomerase family protein [Mycoplasma phocoeninasale]MBN0970747.1 triosephosphate isomerase [Mycoplasma phocoeninasale]QJG66604.1 triosephosphate isomerase [Mycoplasma phocoeninasale]
MKYLIANLKMNLTYSESENYIKKIENAYQQSEVNGNVQLGMAFSYDAISLSNKCKKRSFWLGSQNIGHKIQGALTGEVSIRSAEELGLDFVIIGHSERRLWFNENNELINQKLALVEKTNLKAILCIGENHEEFSSGRTEEVIKNQLAAALKNVNIFDKLLISYEPVYCIGNGVIPEKEHIQKIVNLIHSLTNKNIPILYGGSVCQANILEIKEIENLSGFLVGTAAIKAEDFIELSKAL